MIGVSKGTSARAYQVLGTTTITSTGAQSYTIPAGAVYVEVEIWGAGGGGGLGYGSSGGKGGSSYQAGGGGSGGAYVKHQVRIADLRLNDTLNFTVGAGGSGDHNTNNGGQPGGDTSIDTHKRSTTTITSFSSITAGGGEGGLSQGFAFSGDYGDAGVASNGNITNTNGTDGGARLSATGSTHNGKAGGAAGNGGNGGAPGETGVQFASQGGVSPGGGGGGGASSGSNTSGGAGANGKVIVKAYG
jgi:hypothetical protein